MVSLSHKQQAHNNKQAKDIQEDFRMCINLLHVEENLANTQTQKCEPFG